MIFAAAAAAAAAGSFCPGLELSRGSGLLLRVGSDLFDGGDLERRSNLDGRLGSGSRWSKRDRLRGSSDILAD